MSHEPPANHYLGVHGSARGWIVSGLATHFPKLLVVTSDRKTSETLCADLAAFQKARRIEQYTSWETLPFEEVSPQIGITADRIRVAKVASAPAPSIIVASIEALAQRAPTSWYVNRLALTLNTATRLTRDDLIEHFIYCGYRRVPLVEEVGDLAVRGAVIDFFPAGVSEPIRISIDGVRIAELRSFNSSTQRSKHQISEIEVVPVREQIPLQQGSPFHDKLAAALGLLKERAQKIGTPPSELARFHEALEHGLLVPGIELVQVAIFPERQTLLDVCHPETRIVLDDPAGVKQHLEEIGESYRGHAENKMSEHYLVPDADSLIAGVAEIERGLARFPLIDFNSLEARNATRRVRTVHSTSNIEVSTKLKTKVGSGEAFQPLESFIHEFRKQGYRVAFFVGSESRAQRLNRLLLEYNIDAPPSAISAREWLERDFNPPVLILHGHLSEGVRLKDEKIIFLSETEIFGERSYRERATTPQSITRRLLNTLSQLKPGDYVVHSDYGIGLYRGLQHLNLDDVAGDFMQIDYLDSRLYLPVHNISKIQKYSAGEGQKPKLDKLASTRWKKTKAKVRESVISIAGELIKLYAARSVSKGWRFEPSGAEDDRFADGFAFNETPDQLKAIQETLADMALDRPMDRLVCGDVGFGKTEVALRAAFKCTQHARQVAVLVPTTILVEQHRSNFEKRFHGYSVNVGAVSRFYPPKKNSETLEKLSKGELDIIIGTHRLLSKDVQFKDLGLVVVDEEHRFGVKQKERLKQMKKQVDVLTLTATPIPRTLHMGLLGIRDASIITTPPHDRRVIRTYVASYSDTLVRDAIMREIDRGGQAFYLHNRVQSIDVVAARLAALVPEARFGFAHGQMSEAQLEQIMLRFMNHELDVLISTTIIESGLDIPNANTMIVERADALGLAQLYQIRGRVGRSTRQAYAYLLVPKQEKLSAEARQRLAVLQSLDDLGIGFQLALRDLEIRGAGNLLGKEQSGNVAAIGFELYTRILKEAVMHLKGEEDFVAEEIDPEVTLNMSAYIPDDYIPDISERLVIYQRLGGISSAQESHEIEEELLDRFGTFGAELRNLLELMQLKAVLKSFGVVKVELKADKIAYSFAPRARIDGAKLAQAMLKDPERIKFSKNLVLTVRTDDARFYSPSDVEAYTVHLFEKLLPPPADGGNSSPGRPRQSDTGRESVGVQEH